MRKVKAKSGFTLIELLLTLGVLAIGLVSIFSLLPGVTQFSRELRDEDRMQGFADAVFATMEWRAIESTDSEVTSEDSKIRLFTLLNEQTLKIDATEQAWPDTLGVEDLVPQFFYTLAINTNSATEIEVRLRVRPQSRSEMTEFTRILYPQVEAW